MVSGGIDRVEQRRALWAAPDLDLNAKLADGVTSVSGPDGDSGTVASGDGFIQVSNWADPFDNDPALTTSITISGGAITFGYTRAASAQSQSGLGDYIVDFLSVDLTQYSGFQLTASQLGTAPNNGVDRYFLLVLGGAEYDISPYSDGSYASITWDSIGYTPTGLVDVSLHMWLGLDGRNFVDQDGVSYSQTISNFQLNGMEQGVPEPETVWMIVAVLASLAVTFRGQLTDLTRRFVKS